MKKLDKHVYLTSEEYGRILDYQKKNNLSFTDAVCFLCNTAFDNTNILDRISKLESTLNYIVKKLGYIISLCEQIYSDMDFDNLTDPKNSKALNEFHKKIGNKYIYD